MKILYSAFECNPSKGSDMYVGWSWAYHMSKINDVHVLTCTHNKADIEQYTRTNNVKATFHYLDVPLWLRKMPKHYFPKYIYWNYLAYKYAKRLHKKQKFDIVHLVSIADFRVVGWLWKLKDIKFIFGPVGGGQLTPKIFSPYVANHKFKENLRKWINRIAISLPIYKKGIHTASLTLISNDETIDFIQQYVGKDLQLKQVCELGIDRSYLDARANLVHKQNGKIHILVSGRLKYRKGIALLIHAISKMMTKSDFVVDIYGGGEEKYYLIKQVQELGIDNLVKFHGTVSFKDMQKIYQESDIYVLPSLRETTGTAVIEGMANKLPVIALNQNGVKYLVGKECGILVPICYTLEETITEFALALDTLVENHDLRIKLGNNGYNRLVKNYTWDYKVLEFNNVYKSLL